MKKDIIEETEKRLFEEIQVIVEELPWTHEANMYYLAACVHEAAHGVVTIRVCQDFNNPEGTYECKFEAGVWIDETGTLRHEGVASRGHSDSLKHTFLFSPIPTLIYKARCMAGCILSDEFFAKYYGWRRIHDDEELKKEYGAYSDFRGARRNGIVGLWLSRLMLRLSYKDPLVRLTHLRLIRDILKAHGELTIDPRTYMK